MGPVKCRSCLATQQITRQGLQRTVARPSQAPVRCTPAAKRTVARDGGEEAQVLQRGALAHEHQREPAVRQVRPGRQPLRAHVAAARRHYHHHALEAALCAHTMAALRVSQASRSVCNRFAACVCLPGAPGGGQTGWAATMEASSSRDCLKRRSRTASTAWGARPRGARCPAPAPHGCAPGSLPQPRAAQRRMRRTARTLRGSSAARLACMHAHAPTSRMPPSASGLMQLAGASISSLCVRANNVRFALKCPVLGHAGEWLPESHCQPTDAPRGRGGQQGHGGAVRAPAQQRERASQTVARGAQPAHALAQRHQVAHVAVGAHACREAVPPHPRCPRA